MLYYQEMKVAGIIFLYNKKTQDLVCQTKIPATRGNRDIFKKLSTYFRTIQFNDIISR